MTGTPLETVAAQIRQHLDVVTTHLAVIDPAEQAGVASLLGQADAYRSALELIAEAAVIDLRPPP